VSGVVVWFTGLPASGKTTLANRVRARLSRGSVVLDSDELREALGAFDYRDRDRFYDALGKLAALLARQDLVVLVAATAPRRVHRDLARAIAPAFVEVWVKTSIASCEARDVKGLYARARAGDAPDLPGVGAPYEPPVAPDVTAGGGHDDSAVTAIVAAVLARDAQPLRGRI
jgi:adenylylsulfate kinase